MKLSMQFLALLVIALLISTGIIIISGFQPVPHASSPGMWKVPDSLYAGSASCLQCHQSLYESYTKTSHYITSRPASGRFIKGNFTDNKNVFSYNQFIKVKMEKKGNGFFETTYINEVAMQSEPIDLVIGSGKNGQTFLYWKNNLIYQLPVSFHVPTKSWCNSPGYPTAVPIYDRLIPARCLECHGSYAEFTDMGNNINYFNKQSIVYGIDCERCHGPLANHVNYHTANPREKTARYVLKKEMFTRQQNLDVCALCHSGIRIPVQQAFSFKAGDNLNDFLQPHYNTDSAAYLDVHGNQYGLLTSSMCFQKSNMTCSSCHNPHVQEVNNPVLFSQRCIVCHNRNSVECKFDPKGKFDLNKNCIDCHMPILPSGAIFLQLADLGKSTPDFIRTHKIGMYPEATKEFLKKNAP